MNVLIAELLKVVAPVIAGLIAVEYSKGLALLQKYGALAVAIAGVVYGFAAQWVAGHIPGIVLPADYTTLNADAFTGILTALIAYFTHTQASLAKVRSAKKLTF